MERETYVLDTNAILYSPDIVHDLVDAEIIIPQVVLQELDKIKLASSDRDLRFRARKASRFLFELAENGSLTEGIHLDNGSHVKVALFDPGRPYPDNLSIKNSDDKILAIAYQVAQKNKKKTTLFTNDLNMLLKAQLLGLKTNRFAEEPSTFLEKIGSRFKLHKKFKAAFPFLIVLFIGAFAIFMYSEVAKVGRQGTDLPPELEAQYEMFKVKEQEYKRILKEDPGNLESLIGLGNLYFDTKKYQEAVDHYRKALKINPDDLDVRTDMAVSYFYLGMNDLAASELKTVISKNPSHAKAHYNLAVVYRRMGRIDDAIKEFQEFLKLVPYGPDAQFAYNQMVQLQQEQKEQQ